MSEKFSAALRIGDLNDFIAPSQACIVSLKGLKANKPDKSEVFPISVIITGSCSSKKKKKKNFLLVTLFGRKC